MSWFYSEIMLDTPTHKGNLGLQIIHTFKKNLIIADNYVKEKSKISFLLSNEKQQFIK